MKYEQFLAAKRHTSWNYGFDAQWMPECAFDFQRFIIEKALRKGRIGIFADTGLGKTLMQVAIAENVIRQTNQRMVCPNGSASRLSAQLRNWLEKKGHKEPIVRARERCDDGEGGVWWIKEAEKPKSVWRGLEKKAA